ncbi:MAG: CPBP family intramembrane metalloprotease [Planctomycetes bacterium]|nr:CPBP family intramembrane metalloprotease [Planctomycetota bacterium]
MGLVMGISVKWLNGVYEEGSSRSVSRLVSLIMIAPLAEEFIFRGMLWPPRRTVGAIFVVSMVFTLRHWSSFELYDVRYLDGWIMCIATGSVLLILGLLCAWARCAGGLVSAIVLHSAYNGALLL